MRLFVFSVRFMQVYVLGFENVSDMNSNLLYQVCCLHDVRDFN